MTIEINKEQYVALLLATQVAEAVYGPLGDSVDEKYKQQSNNLEDLTDYLLNYATDFGLDNIVDEYDDKKFLQEEFYEAVAEDMYDYDEFAAWEWLAYEMAIKEYLETNSEENLKKMTSEKRMIEIWTIEEKWNKEFEKNGLNNLVLQSD